MKRKIKLFSSFMVICMCFAMFCSMVPMSMANEEVEALPENEENAAESALTTADYAIEGTYKIRCRGTGKELVYLNGKPELYPFDDLSIPCPTLEDRFHEWKLSIYTKDDGTWFIIRPMENLSYALAFINGELTLKYWPDGENSSGNDIWMVTLMSGNTYTIRSRDIKQPYEKYPYLHDKNGAPTLIYNDYTTTGIWRCMRKIPGGYK